MQAVEGANNFLTFVSTTGALAKQISYTSLRQAQGCRESGQIMVRTQTTNGSSTSPKEFSFYFNGVKVGAIGNNGTDNVDYATAITQDGETQ